MPVPRSRPSAARFLVAAGVLAAHASGAAAQTPPVAVGTRVRVTAPALGAAPRAARVLGAHADTLAVRPAGTGDSVALPLGAITRLEVSGGRHTRVLKGVGTGFLVGAAGGVLVGAVTHEDCSGPGGCYFETNRGGDAILGGIAGGLLGVVTGAVVGAVWRAERWERVQFAGRSSHLRVGPGHRGGLAVAVAF